jgi:hypothetical protein
LPFRTVYENILKISHSSISLGDKLPNQKRSACLLKGIHYPFNEPIPIARTIYVSNRVQLPLT